MLTGKDMLISRMLIARFYCTDSGIESEEKFDPYRERGSDFNDTINDNKDIADENF